MSLPWFPWYPGDYATDTQDLSCNEHGCYRLLLDASWTRGPLPDDLNRLQRLTANCDAETVRYVLERFWQRTPDGWTNRRLERVRNVQQKKHASRVSAGQRGGKKKAENQQLASNARALPEHCQSNISANQGQDGCEHEALKNTHFEGQQNQQLASNARILPEHCSTNQNQNQNQIEESLLADPDGSAETDAKAEKKTAAMERFERFWSLYPRKVQKKAAMAKWRSLRKAQQMDAIEHISRQPFADREQRYIPHPTTYLNGEHWDDADQKPDLGKPDLGLPFWEWK